MIINYTIRA